MKLYSPSKRGFYAPDFHGQNIPHDVVEVPDEQHAALFAAVEGTDKEIVPGPGGFPVVAEPAPETLPQQVARVLVVIDADTDAIINATIGARAEEYRQAEADAGAFRDAGYVGTVPAFVADHQAAKGTWTAQQAADDILATAAAWRTAQAAIRANRLQCKEIARRAANAAAVDGALQQWAMFVAAVRTQLGIGA